MSKYRIELVAIGVDQTCVVGVIEVSSKSDADFIGKEKHAASKLSRHLSEKTALLSQTFQFLCQALLLYS